MDVAERTHQRDGRPTGSQRAAAGAAQKIATRRGGPVAHRERGLSRTAPGVVGGARAKAGGVHGGWGFVGENPDFAQAVRDGGLIWVGPPVGAMRALGDKARAKALAEQHGVPLLAGYHGTDQAPDALADHAQRIGYPVFIKASAGGGGRGMRLVEGAADFQDALPAPQREAPARFRDAHG